MKSQADNLSLSELAFLPFRYVKAKMALEVDNILKSFRNEYKGILNNGDNTENIDLEEKTLKVDLAQPKIESAGRYVEFREIGAVRETEDSDKSEKAKKKMKSKAKLNSTDNTKYENRTKKELYDRAKELDIDGRSTMNKSELIKALRDQQ